MNAFLPQLYSITFLKSPFAVTDFPLLCLGCYTPLSPLCGEITEEVTSNSEELMCGRIKMMTAGCPSFAQRISRFVRVSVLISSRPKTIFHASYLLDHYQNHWGLSLLAGDTSLMEDLSANLTGPSWPAGELPPFVPNISVRFLCRTVTCDSQRSWVLLRAATTLLSSLVLMKPSDGSNPSSSVANVFPCCMTRNTLLVLLWVSPMLEGTLPWSTNVMNLFYGPRANSHCCSSCI